MNGRKHQPVIDIIEWSYADADARLPDEVADFLLQFAERFDVVELVELQKAGFDVV
jgi:hypothetical protein